MSESDADAAADRVDSALADAISNGDLGDSEGFVSGWVLVGTYVDANGESRTFFLSNEGARLHETLGLLTLGDVAWREQARRWIHDDDESGDP